MNHKFTVVLYPLVLRDWDRDQGHVRLRCKVEKATLHLGLTSTIAGAPDLDPRDWCIFEACLMADMDLPLQR